MRMHVCSADIVMVSCVAHDIASLYAMRLLKCRYTVAFIMPSKYTKMTLPKPENANVQVGLLSMGSMSVHVVRPDSLLLPL